MKKNERSVQLHVTQYEKMISDLRSALATANEKIKTLETAKVVEPFPALSSSESEVKTETQCLTCIGCSEKQEISESRKELGDPSPVFPTSEFNKARDAWGTLFHDKREVQHKIAVLEQLEKDFEYKIMIKNQKNDRVESISLSTLR